MGNMKIIVVFFTSFLLAYTLAEYTLTEKIEELKNQVQMEMYASLFYQTCAHHFESSDEAWHGFSKFFYDQSLEEKEHADKLLTYLNQRNVAISTVISLIDPCEIFKKEICDLFKNGFTNLNISFVISTSIQLEKMVLHSLENIIKNCQDSQLTHFIEHEYLDEQMRSLKEFYDMRTQINRFENDFVGLLLLDRWLLEGKKKIEL